MTDFDGAYAEIDRLQREVVELRAERDHLQGRANSLQHALDTTNAVYDDALDEIEQRHRAMRRAVDLIEEGHAQAAEQAADVLRSLDVLT